MNSFFKIKKLGTKPDSHISAFGEFIVRFEIPKNISKKLEDVYRKTKRIEDLDLKKTLDIFKQDAEIEVTVIKDKMLADKIKGEIVSEF